MFEFPLPILNLSLQPTVLASEFLVQVQVSEEFVTSVPESASVLFVLAVHWVHSDTG